MDPTSEGTNLQTRSEKQALELWESWQLDPVKFLEEAFKIDKFLPGGLSRQQREAFNDVKELLTAKFRKASGLPTNPKQKKLAKKLGISIRAGQGPGKTTWAAMLVYWYLICHWEAIVPCFGPKSEQLKATLFKNISKVVAHANLHGTPLIRNKAVVQSDKVYCTLGGDNKYEWAASIKSVQNVSGEGAKGISAQGDHAQWMMIVTEESSAEELEAVFPLIEGTIQSDPLNLVVMIGNPNRGKGHFYDSHNSMKDHWVAIQWSNEDCEFIPQESIERAAEKHGRESNFFRVRILGEFPLLDPDSYLPQYALDNMFDNYEIDEEALLEERLVLGVDVAGGGRDTTTIIERRGDRYGPIYSFKNVDRMEIANWILAHCAEQDPLAIIVDSNGIGDGVYSRLREMGLPAYGISSHSMARDTTKYHRLRDELLWKLRDPIMRGSIKIRTTGPDIPASKAKKIQDDLKEEIGILKYETITGGRTKFISKPLMKARLGRSPDYLDAFWLASYMNVQSLDYMSGKSSKYMQAPPESYEEDGWMSL